MQLTRRLTACAALAVATLIVMSGCNFGSVGQVGAQGTTNGVFLTSKDFTMRTVAMPTAYRDGVIWTLGRNYVPTELNVNNSISDCTATVRSCVYALNYGDNRLAGWNACLKNWSGAHPNMHCGQARTRINTYYTPGPKSIACHEIGHSVGLRHSDDTASCMHTPITSAILTQHDIDHINGHY